MKDPTRKTDAWGTPHPSTQLTSGPPVHLMDPNRTQVFVAPLERKSF